MSNIESFQVIKDDEVGWEILLGKWLKVKTAYPKELTQIERAPAPITIEKLGKNKNQKNFEKVYQVRNKKIVNAPKGGS